MDTATRMGSLVSPVMAAQARMVREITRERSNDSAAERRAAGKNLGGRWLAFTDSRIRHALRLIQGGERAIQVARNLRMSRATGYRRI